MSHEEILEKLKIDKIASSKMNQKLMGMSKRTRFLRELSPYEKQSVSLEN
jgi:hypothetical protein